MEPGARCPACGFENPPGMRFCGDCGTALARAGAAGEERKLVTVLFADVVGSTELSGAVDPERLRDQMVRFFTIAREEIERYGGTVEKFIGDAVMAVFGLPAIHEDDPERAARAAIAIRTRLQPQVDGGALPGIRIGITTGEVVANPRAAEKGEFLVTGEVVNLAARLQQHAGAGQILAGERTMQALRRMATLEPVPALTVKGASAPMPAWTLLAIQPPRERELRATPFVGREEELALLASHLRRMRREGHGHAVTILGPAGVGKTRLAREFRVRAADTHTLSGRAVPYGTGVPFWAIGEAIREECGIVFGDPLEVARRKLHDATERLEVAEAIPALLSVLGMGGERVDLTREALFSGMRSFFQALAQRSPVLLIVEDLHLAEDVTLDFLEQAADWIRSIPMLLLGLSRPEMLERRVTWMGGRRSATTLVLDPLGGEESRELAAAILGDKDAPGALLDAVLSRAEGNPLFVEEMLRTLIERGVLAESSGQWQLTVPLAQLSIPDTVHAVIAARVDALPRGEKQVLQGAALQGKDFWRGGLRVVAEENHIDETVGALVAKELILHKWRSTLAGEEEFAFRHILIRDVAYASIPKSQRWPKHARVAEWMEAIMGDRRAEFADIIAHHWLQVLALRQELGLPPEPGPRDQAITHLLLAGDRAAALYANTTALDHYSRVLDLEPPAPVRLRVLLRRGEVWMLLGQFDRARDDFSAGRALTQQAGDRRGEAMALDHLGHSFRKQDQIARALEHLEPALALSREVGDPILTGRILNHIGFTYFSNGRDDEAIQAHQESRTLQEAAGDKAGLAESLHGLGDALMFLGDFQESIDSYLESISICEELGNRSLSAESRFMIGFAKEKMGEYTAGEADIQRSLSTLREIGDIWNTSPAMMGAALIAVTLGDFNKALEYLNHGLGIARQLQAIRFKVFHLFGFALLYRELEDAPSAWRAGTEAVALAEQVPRGAWLPVIVGSLAIDAALLGNKAEATARLAQARQALDSMKSKADFPQEVAYAEARVMLAAGSTAEAVQAARRLVDIAEATGTIRHWRVPALLVQAEAALALGDAPSAVAAYHAAAEEAERVGRRPALWRAHAGLADAYRALGQSDAAAASAQRARDIIDRLAATIPDERLRAAFLQSAKVQRVTALAGA